MRSRFHDEALDAVAKELRLAGLRVATEVGVEGGRADIVVLNGIHWAWMLEVKVSSIGLQAAPAQLRRYIESSDHEDEVGAATLIVPDGLLTPRVELEAERYSVDVWTCNFTRLVSRMKTAAPPPLRSYVSLPTIYPPTRARMSRDARAWYSDNRKAA